MNRDYRLKHFKMLLTTNVDLNVGSGKSKLWKIKLFIRYKIWVYDNIKKLLLRNILILINALGNPLRNIKKHLFFDL